MELTDQQAQEMAQKLHEDRVKIQKAYLEQRKELDDDMIVSGKTVKQWRDELWVMVPSADLNPQICMETNLAIMRSANIVDFEHSKAEMRKQILDRQASSAYFQEFDHVCSEARTEGKRQPSAATIEVMAEVASDVYKRVAIEADNELKFWKNIKDHLQFAKKIMEQAGYNVGAEIRSEGHVKYLETLGKHYGGNSNE
jgi:hypothetical protein